jgi:hypothetical protein
MEKKEIKKGKHNKKNTFKKEKKQNRELKKKLTTMKEKHT